MKAGSPQCLILVVEMIYLYYDKTFIIDDKNPTQSNLHKKGNVGSMQLPSWVGGGAQTTSEGSGSQWLYPFTSVRLNSTSSFYAGGKMADGSSILVSFQLSTAVDTVIPLSAGSPPTRFPVAGKGWNYHIYIFHPCTFKLLLEIMFEM